LRKLIILGTALAVLAGTGVAFAAAQFNTYHATENFCKSTPSSPTATSCAPAGAKGPVSISEHWTANGNGTNHNARPITDIVVKQYGVQSFGQDFPTCTAAKINAAGNAMDWNKVCPKGSLIGGGPVHAELLAQTGTGSPAACNPFLDIYNGGKSTQTFFFVVGPQSPGGKYACATAKTGTSCAAYSGSVKYANNVGTITIHLPPCASTAAANLTGVYASLHKLDVNYPDTTKGKGGHYYLQSMACKSGKRPYSTTFTAAPFTAPPGQKPQSHTVPGSAPC
jgi:hypothetical protein